MENQTLVQLKALARQRGLKGYSRMRKADLIHLLSHSSLLDEPVRDNTPTLTPVKASVPARVMKAIKNKVNKWTDWFLSYIPPKPKIVDSALESFKQQIQKLYKKEAPFILKESASALRGFTKVYKIEGQPSYDPASFLKKVKPNVLQIFTNNPSTKVKLILNCIMAKQNIETNETIYSPANFHSYIEINLQGSDVIDMYNKMTGQIFESIANYNYRGSNWTFKSIVSLDIHTVRYQPLRGSSYIQLPVELAQKKALINMKNKDDQCFKWCIARAMNPKEDHPERIDKKLTEASEELNWDNITFPVNLKAIDKFERQNPTISVNVFGYDKSIYPLRVSKYDDLEHLVDLLLICEESKQHYCLIKNLSRLVSNQVSKHEHKSFICRRCLNPFNTEYSMNKHIEYCSSHETVKVEMPKEGTALAFNHFFKSMKVPFVVYADFESFTQKLNTTQPNPGSSYTKQYQKHTPSGFCYYIKCFDDKVYKQDPVIYTKQSEDEDIAQIFVDRLEKDVRRIYKRCGWKKMVITGAERNTFEQATSCWICQGDLKDDKVRDHCHYTGKYRGAAHNKCNLQYRKPKFTPVIFHNLSGYDSHLFIKNLGRNEGNIKCIPNNEEKYISFSKDIVVDTYKDKNGKEKEVGHELRFIDSFKFMASSLDKLVGNLQKDQFTSLGKMYNGDKLDLLMRKGVYPYDYVDGLSRLAETRLPPKDAFYSKLNCEHISDEDYAHAQRVWETFACATLKDYHDLYLMSDVLLLTDVFETFRDVCLINYDLDPAWYYTAPGLTWDAALKKTKVELELLTDPDMLLMFEQGIRGGVSSIMTRHGKANNKYMGEDFNPAEPSKYLQYLDANNLYGWAMSKPLPTKGFKWMTEDELTNWKDIPCILEVDLEYPKELHDAHNDYPLAPERLTVDKVEKLIPNLNDKVQYVLHYENLKLYESLGLKTTKIHRGIKFEESPWLKEYIDLNTSLRAQASNSFEKDFFKLMNNSVFGKTMENIRNRVDIQLVNNEVKAKKLVARPNYQHCTIFDENLVAIHMKKTKLVFNKPVYLGMCILDLSKTLMYDFHYNYIKRKYSDKAKLLFTDTDSLAYEIETEDFNKDIAPDIERLFDTSEIPKDHPSGMPAGMNKKVIGMFKDECAGKVMAEFVGLRAKLYSYKMHEGKEEERTAASTVKRCKGIKTSVVKKDISFEDYKTCLLSKQEQMRKMNVIRSHKHEIYTEEVNKIALSAEDDKRVIQEDGIHTLAYGHYLIENKTL